MASINLPVDIKKLLAAQTASINANTDTKATETQTSVNTNVDAEGAATRTQVANDTADVDGKLDAMTVVDGQLDNNVTAINNFTAGELAKVKSSFVNQALPLNLNPTVDLFTAPDLSVWLKSGVVDTDVATYPDATQSLLLTAQAPSFSVADTSPYGIAWDGTHFWVVGGTNKYIYKYDAAGAYTGVSFLLNGPIAAPRGVAWDGTNLWIANASGNNIRQCSRTTGLTGAMFSTVGEGSSSVGVTWDGTHFWVLFNSELIVCKYDAAGDYTGVSFSVSDVISPKDIGWDGTHFWIISNGNTIYFFDAAGAYTGYKQAIGNSSCEGIGYDGVNMHITSRSSDDATPYNYAPVVGVQVAGTVGGLPTYARIK